MMAVETFTVRPQALTGDVGPRVSPGAEKTIVWDSTKDVDNLQVDRYVFRVRVSANGPTPRSRRSPRPAGPTAPPAGRGGAATSTPKSGGLSKGAIIALTGGAAAAGVGIAAAKSGGGNSPPPASPNLPNAPTPILRSFTSSLSGTMNGVFPGCSITNGATGALILSLVVAVDGGITGSASGNATFTTTFSSCNPAQVGNVGNKGFSSTSVSGTTGRITFNFMETITVPNGTRTDAWSFSGSLANDIVTGTLRYDTTHSNGMEAATFNVTAR